MNVEIGVGSFEVGFSATLIEPTPVTRIIYVIEDTIRQPLTHARSTIISLNGHSLSAVNPDLTLVGGKATLVAA
jgi:hypothetical protein